MVQNDRQTNGGANPTNGSTRKAVKKPFMEPVEESVEVAKQGDGRRARSAKTRADLLLATERIIRRDGVGSLTLERVAEEAGVSKGGLLYHFKSKQALVRTLLADTMDRTSERLDELASEGGPGAFSTAYLDYVRTGEHASQGVATGIFASAALDEGELAPAQEQFATWQNRLRDDDGLSPSTALLARIVGDGLWLIDLFGLAPPTDEDRELVLDVVQDLINRDADPVWT